MDRRKFLKGTTLLSGALALNPFDLLLAKDTDFSLSKGKLQKISSLW